MNYKKMCLLQKLGLHLQVDIYIQRQHRLHLEMARPYRMDKKNMLSQHQDLHRFQHYMNIDKTYWLFGLNVFSRVLTWFFYNTQFCIRPNSPQRLLPLISTVTIATTSKSGSRETDLFFFTFIFKTEYFILFQFSFIKLLCFMYKKVKKYIYVIKNCICYGRYFYCDTVCVVNNG